MDREGLVRRHDVVVRAIDPRSPLSVGNGSICATVDVTGLQTFPEQYPVADPAGGAAGTLLGTQSQWAWHSVPAPGDVDLGASRRPYRTARGEVLYVDAPPLAGSDDSALDDAHRWLRANPHRLDLARIGLVARSGGTGGAADGEGAAAPGEPGDLDGFRALSPSELGEVRQRLDLWAGSVRTAVRLAGRERRVLTVCHPHRDAIGVRVDGAEGLAVRLAFPYGSTSWSNAADWTRPDAHRTEVEEVPGGAVVRRWFDGDAAPLVVVRLHTAGRVRQVGAHDVVVEPVGRALDLVVEPGPGADVPGGEQLDAQGVADASAAHWRAFWRSGGAVDLSASTDPRAHELERRVVLSQYLTAIQCAGDRPPQETGLVCNSWRGRFHLEMHWWHAAHFPLWGRPELLERSLGWYREILPQARETARVQGYDGVRWPKQVGPDGRESPSDIGPFLLWQQPHVVELAELVRRARPEQEADVVARYGELVDLTARFMADVVERGDDGAFHLGPPLVPAQESYASIRERVVDPPFELAQWVWALRTANRWRELAGLEREARWDEVADGMARPVVRDGVLAAIGTPPWTIRQDHPSMVYGLGVVPDVGLLDHDVVGATLRSILEDWDWLSTWGWDYPALAMTAARLGDPETAVDVLLRDEAKNTYLPNGHNHQTDQLPLYLPGNGGLLAAVALMAAGWDGAPDGDAPGFPAGWVVRHEGLVPAP